MRDAPETRAVEPELVPQDVQERGVSVGRDEMVQAVDGNSESGHGCTPSFQCLPFGQIEGLDRLVEAPRLLDSSRGSLIRARVAPVGSPGGARVSTSERSGPLRKL